MSSIAAAVLVLVLLLRLVGWGLEIMLVSLLLLLLPVLVLPPGLLILLVGAVCVWCCPTEQSEARSTHTQTRRHARSLPPVCGLGSGSGMHGVGNKYA